METRKLTMAQALVAFLNQQYIDIDGKEERFVEGIFTIFGHGNVLGLGQALEENPGELKVYQGHNEQGMAHVATAFAKQNNCMKIMAATSSVGPGAANMLTAAATATANNIPLLLLPGDVYASRQPDPVLQQVEHAYNPTISTNDAFRSVCRYWNRIERPEQIMSAAIYAMEALTDAGNRGAVCLALPQDVQGEVYDYPESFFRKRVHRICRQSENSEVISKAIELLRNKKYPLIICGGGVKYALANTELQTFAERYGIPIGETQAGKSAIESTFVYNLGGIGVTGNLAANTYAKQADCIIAIGTRLTDFTTGSKSLFESNPDFININASKFQSVKFDGLPLVGDAKTILQQLLDEMEDTPKFIGVDQVVQMQKEWEKELQRLSQTTYQEENFVAEVTTGDQTVTEFASLHQSMLTQTQVISYINTHIADDAIVVGASGSLPGCLQRMWVSKEKNTYHMEYGYSCMGYEIAAGLGAKLANEDKEVYVFVGDGSYQMLHSELVTSLQLGKKINVLLFDNNGYGCINNLQMENGMDSFLTEFRNTEEQFHVIDYAISAGGYGVKTYSVKSMEELVFALEDSKKQAVSTLIDIKVLPKTMTHGYDCWWNVGVAQQSKKEEIKAAAERKNKAFSQARKY